MVVVSEVTLLLIDTTLRGAGTCFLALVAFRWYRDGSWRNPLEPLTFTGAGPTIGHVLGVLAAYFLLAMSLLRLANVDSELVQLSGSHAWHVAQSIDAGVKLVLSAVILAILHGYKPFRADNRASLGLPGLLGVSLVTVLIILPVAYLQLQTGQIVWYWLRPAAAQPIHAVLEALESSAWGDWGIVQLTVIAVIVAPLAEELFFRGLLLQTLWRYLDHAWLAIVLSGVLFGLIHHEQPQDVIPLVTMGIILGLVRVRYRSLWVCVAIHGLFNARTMTFVLLNPDLARASW